MSVFWFVQRVLVMSSSCLRYRSAEQTSRPILRKIKPWVNIGTPSHETGLVLLAGQITIANHKMPKFKIIIHCKQLNVPLENGTQIIGGFYTVRFASGLNEQDALKNAVRKLEKEETFKQMKSISKSRDSSEPIFEIDYFETVPFYAGFFNSKKGYTFYPVD